MDQYTQRAILEQSIDASWDAIRSHSVVYVDRNYGHAQASGTLVSIGNRLFIATAAHTIPTRPSGRLCLLTKRPRRVDEGFPAIVNSNKTPSEYPDVGYLELDPTVALDYLKMTPCPVDRLSNLGPDRARRPVLLTGSPRMEPGEELISASTKVINYASVAIQTTTIHPDAWPEPVDSAPRRDSTVDVFLNYPTGTVQMGDTWLDCPPKAVGMSGGGIWDVGTDAGILWSPETTRLFAIQSSWDSRDPTRRHVRAMQVIHWLRLIHADYTDLRDGLEAQFKELAC